MQKENRDKYFHGISLTIKSRVCASLYKGVDNVCGGKVDRKTWSRPHKYIISIVGLILENIGIICQGLSVIHPVREGKDGSKDITNNYISIVGLILEK